MQDVLLKDSAVTASSLTVRSDTCELAEWPHRLTREAPAQLRAALNQHGGCSNIVVHVDLQTPSSVGLELAICDTLCRELPFLTNIQFIRCTAATASCWEAEATSAGRTSFNGTGRPAKSMICVVWLITTSSPLCRYGEGSSASAFLT